MGEYHSNCRCAFCKLNKAVYDRIRRKTKTRTASEATKLSWPKRRKTIIFGPSK